jgi:ribonuclease R
MTTNTTDLRSQIITLLTNSPEALTKNQLARLLLIQGDARIDLKAILRELEQSGIINRGHQRRYELTDKPIQTGLVLPLEIVTVDDDGQLMAEALDWTRESAAPRYMLLMNRRTRQTTLGVGAHVLARIINKEEAEVIKVLEKRSLPHLGIFAATKDGGGRLSTVHRKDRFPGARLTPNDAKGLKEGDIVSYAVTTHGIRILENIGPVGDPKTFSLMAIHAHQIPHEFPTAAIELAEKGRIPALGRRADLRNMDLVTIDGEDARDFDDAVWAQADQDPRNQGGWRILVAIADVSYYVRANDELDHEARKRGNSVYFPDRVVPMLPEALSNEMCSLKPGVDRACMAIEMVITEGGKVKSHRVKRGLMRSRARLTYTQVQKAIDGNPDAATEHLLTDVIQPLYGAYQSLLNARKKRGTLDIEQTERQVIFGPDGYVDRIIPRERHDSHKLIEEFMIAANVAAAKTLEAKGWPCVYRIHDAPDPIKVANLRQTLKQVNVNFNKATKALPQHFNDVLHRTSTSPISQMVNDLILRCQSQAKYSPVNIGHYGLGLQHYAHFTSPIRRYSDLLVHRALIAALDLGDDGFHDRNVHLHHVCDHISHTERAAATAEREVMDRFTIAYTAPHVGETFDVVIVGVNKFGLFVMNKETGAQGFIPKNTLFNDTFHYDEPNHRLVGRRTRKAYQLGSAIRARLAHADVITNSLSFTVDDGSEKPAKGSKKSGKRRR